MSTRSDIIVHRADGKWARVYCHHDGYLEGVGRTLAQHYNSQARVEELVREGDMSSLGRRCDRPEGHSFAQRHDGCTVYYGRDRGESGTSAQTGETLAEVWPEADTWTEFTYVWDGKWGAGDPDGEAPHALHDLDALLAGEVELRPAIKTPWGVIGGHGPIDKVD